PTPIIVADDIIISPGVPFTMPLTMRDFYAPGIGALTLEVSFDPLVISPDGCDPDPDGVFDTAICNPDYAQGVMRLTFLSTVGVVDSHPLADLRFIGNGGIGDHTGVAINIVTLTFPDGVPIPSAAAVDGSVALDVLPGDVNCDDATDAIDAMFILQYDVGLLGASQQCPPPPDSIYEPACDVSGDTQCDSVDALFIMQCEVGIPNDLCPGTTALHLAFPPFGVTQNANITIGQGTVQSQGEITIPITAQMIDSSLGAATLEVRFDPDVVRPTSCEADPDHRFDIAICNPQFADDVVRFTLASPQGVTGDAPLANITFTAVGAPGEMSDLDLDPVTFSNPDGEAIPHQIASGRIEIQSLRIYLPITR
ncbi:MAG TPA: hypothetical protein G4O05_02565, partial [Caldilineae bacterium]|nr:hypothetical protein [Caldilineae bacterium]